MSMDNFTMNLQLFADGGAASAAGSSGADGSVAGGTADKTAEVANPHGSKGSLENVVYGKPTGEVATPTSGSNATSGQSKSQQFEEMIKGEFKKEFADRTQAIIDARFKETKGMKDTLRSHEPLLKMLAERYGVKDANDVAGLIKAMDEDESYFQREAMEKGLTVEQLKVYKQMERENDELKRAEEERQRQEQTEQIYAGWIKEAEALKAKYGLDTLDINIEVQNPEFTRLLASGVNVEAAYKAVHFDDMIGGAMATTAKNVAEGMAQNVTARQARPAENGASSKSAVTYKSDVSQLTDADIIEINKRVARGEQIRF